ncbi:hypothetical protein ACPPVT_02875 [Angustibacter sp. McL0619]|uniref:hypothetical protein n=1 Tax=Angustibacter sp. McL0619 TaxID=3415676 RepID=UPI003CE7D892
MPDEPWTTVADDQLGLLTRAQLTRLGVTREQLRWRLGRSWRLVLPSVVDLRPTVGQLTHGRLLIAASLEAGGGVISGHHACLWHGLRNARGHRPVLVLVPSRQASRDVGFAQIRRTTRPDARTVQVGSIRIASPARAVADAARTSTSLDEAASIVIEGAQRRLTSLPEVMHEVEAGPRQGSALARRALAQANTGAWSVPEVDLLQSCAGSRVLPHAWPNPELELADGTRLISPDAWFDDIGMAVMVHSRTHHSRDADWEGTVEADGQLIQAGILVLGFTPRSIRREPRDVLRRIERTYATARSSGRLRPDVRMIPRAFGIAT